MHAQFYLTLQQQFVHITHLFSLIGKVNSSAMDVFGTLVVSIQSMWRNKTGKTELVNDYLIYIMMLLTALCLFSVG